MTITPEEIRRLRELVEKATPRPWVLKDKFGFIATAVQDWRVVTQTWDKHEANFHNWRNNAAYIVAACNAVPAMLDEIDRLRETLTKIHISADASRILLKLHGEELDRDDLVEQHESLIADILDAIKELQAPPEEPA